MPYAQWPTRVLGYLVDMLVTVPVVLVFYLIGGSVVASLASMGGDLGSNLSGGACCVLIVFFPLSFLLVGLFNRMYLVSKRGYSIGQGVVKVKVVDANGNLLTMGSAFIRLLAQFGLSLLPLGSLLDLLWPLWDQRKQTLHDKAVGCYVVMSPHA
jgi:uncharacterized RDD family membrane protein YckC